MASPVVAEQDKEAEHESPVLVTAAEVTSINAEKELSEDVPVDLNAKALGSESSSPRIIVTETQQSSPDESSAHALEPGFVGTPTTGVPLDSEMTAMDAGSSVLDSQGEACTGVMEDTALTKESVSCVTTNQVEMAAEATSKDKADKDSESIMNEKSVESCENVDQRQQSELPVENVIGDAPKVSAYDDPSKLGNDIKDLSNMHSKNAQGNSGDGAVVADPTRKSDIDNDEDRGMSMDTETDNSEGNKIENELKCQSDQDKSLKSPMETDKLDEETNTDTNNKKGNELSDSYGQAESLNTCDSIDKKGNHDALNESSVELMEEDSNDLDKESSFSHGEEVDRVNTDGKTFIDAMKEDDNVEKTNPTVESLTEEDHMEVDQVESEESGDNTKEKNGRIESDEKVVKDGEGNKGSEQIEEKTDNEGDKNQVDKKEGDEAKDEASPDQNGDEASPGEKVDETSPDEKEDEAIPDEKADEASPDEKAGEASPDEKKDEAIPDEKADDASPDEKADDASPDEKADDASPDENADEASPDEKADEASPDEKKDEASPDEKKDEASPDEKADEASPDEKADEANPDEKADDASPDVEDEGASPEIHEFPAELLYEYQWPQDKTGDYYMIQEQVSDYLNVLSFKRKYKDLQRRPLEYAERNFLRDRGIVTEMQCDLGLNALKSDEVHDLMAKDYPAKYKDYAHVLHEREKQKIQEKYKEYEAPVIEKSKMEAFRKKAIKSAADFNKFFMRERRESRQAYFDLQTMTVQFPKGKYKVLSKEATAVSTYPVALIPGQFQDYTKKYTSEELKYFPINSAVYCPPKMVGSVYANPDEPVESDHDDLITSQDKTDSDSDSSDSSGTGDSGSDEQDGGKDQVENLVCQFCQQGKESNKDGKPEEIVKCAECNRHGHPACFELTQEMIPMIKTYPWQCMECKTCVECMDPYDEDKMMFCDHCDRGYHTFCVGLKNIPTGRWECPSCRPGPPAKKSRRK